jgi:hypothetical protein
MSCITLCPTCVDRYDWTTPSAPLKIEIATAVPTRALVRPSRPSGIALLNSALIRKAGITPRADETTIVPVTTPSFRQYGRKSRPIRRRFERRTAGSAGRSTGSRGVKPPRT